MDEAPKKAKRRWLPIGMIVVSLLLLFNITDAQASRQYAAMEDKIWLKAKQLANTVDGLYKSEDLPISVQLEDNIQFFLPVRWFFDDNPEPSEYHAIIMLCRDDDIEQPISVWATRAPHRLEETAREMIREHAKHDCQPFCFRDEFRYGGGLPAPDGVTTLKKSVFTLKRYMNFCVDAGEEGRFYIAWAVECNPFAVAMLQLIPVYLLTALLLTALFLTKKKVETHGSASPVK